MFAVDATERSALMAFLDTAAHAATHTFQAPETLLARALAALRARRERRLARLAFRRLEQFDARMLDDMGLTHEDVLWGSSLPLELDAASHVHHRARRRRMKR